MLIHSMLRRRWRRICLHVVLLQVRDFLHVDFLPTFLSRYPCAPRSLDLESHRSGEVTQKWDGRHANNGISGLALISTMTIELHIMTTR